MLLIGWCGFSLFDWSGIDGGAAFVYLRLDLELEVNEFRCCFR